MHGTLNLSAKEDWYAKKQSRNKGSDRKRFSEPPRWYISRTRRAKDCALAPFIDRWHCQKRSRTSSVIIVSAVCRCIPRSVPENSMRQLGCFCEQFNAYTLARRAHANPKTQDVPFRVYPSALYEQTSASMSLSSSGGGKGGLRSRGGCEVGDIDAI